MSIVRIRIRALASVGILTLILLATSTANAAIKPYRGNLGPTPTPVGPPLVEQNLSAIRPSSAVLRPPDDHVYVGTVDYRFLRRSDLAQKVNRIIVISATLDRIKETEDATTLRQQLIREIEDQCLYEWAQLTVLAVHAEQEGITVTPAEVQQKLSELSDMADTNKEAWTAIKAIGISRAELQGYMRDAILAEKLVSKRMAEMLSEEDFKVIYQTRHAEFATPAQVELEFVCMSLARDETLSERRSLFREMEQWRKKAAKSRDFLKFAREEFANPELGRIGGYYGWASPKSLPKFENLDSKDPKQGSVTLRSDDKIVKAVYGLKKGEVSKVLTSATGMYVFHLVDKREASGLNYETARPRVENAMYITFRDRLVNFLFTQHKVYLNPSGLDFDEIAERASKDAETIRAEEQRKREERLMQIAEERFREYERQGLLDRTVRKPDPAALSEKSLEILRKEAERYPERYATPLPN